MACATLTLALAGAAACMGSSGSGRPVAVVDVPLPDVSSAAEVVRTTLRDEHAALGRLAAQSTTPRSDMAEAYGRMGKLFFAAEYFASAKTSFVNAQALAPDDLRWPYLLGHVARVENQPVAAQTHFGRALTLRPDHVPSLVWLAETHLSEGRPAQAKLLLERARALAPQEAATLYGLGRVALEANEYGQAVAYLEQALALAPSASRVRYPLALAYRGGGNRAKAEEHLRLRGETPLPPADPLMAEVAGLLRNTAALETRGAQAMTARQWPEAIAAFREALGQSPSNAFTHLNLGTSLYMTGDRGGALAAFGTAVRLDPQLAKAHYAIGVLMEVDGKEADALAAFGRAVAADAGYGEARLALANALRRNGRTADALPHYDHILRADPGLSQAAFGRAIALARLGRFAQARDRLEEGAKTFADQPGFAHALARVLAASPDARVRDGARALSLMEGLLKTQPQTLPMAETTAMALAELGRFDEALEWQRSAIAVAEQGGRKDLVASLTLNRRLYENRQPCRTPWPDDDPIHRPAPSTP